MTIHPIGTYHSAAKAPYEAARQPMERIQTRGEILLEKGQQFEQALEDLEGFERIWLIYQFHHNEHWKPKVMPPRGSDHKVGVFATRAPYRPNPIGISCVKLIKVEGLRVWVEGADLLDGTPILDIKPYLPYADAFPESKIGWVASAEKFTVQISANAREQIQFLKENELTQLQDFIINQLEFDPTNNNKKRVQKIEDNIHVLAYKTWRVQFQVQGSQIIVENIFSGYNPEERASDRDPYSDKALHQRFLTRFGE